nr:isoprenyl transferase [uncultured Emticicia sp.]
MKENIDLGNLPAHIAVIMDGNGRWAKQQGALRIFGHHHGVKSVRDTVEGCVELGVKYLTLYTFSTENWNRPKLEVDGIMQLLVKTIAEEVPELNKNNVRVKTIGNLDSLPASANNKMLDAVELTKNNTGLTLILALSYSGKWEIVQATKRIATKIKTGELAVEDISENVFSQHLATEDAPDVDLMIRTGGDHRISNYLLWQLAYAELYFIDDLFWPEFRKNHLFEAISSYQNRERRFGKTSEQIK